MLGGYTDLDVGFNCCGLGLHLFDLAVLNYDVVLVGVLLGDLVLDMWISLVWIHGCDGVLVLDFWGRSEAD